MSLKSLLVVIYLLQYFWMCFGRMINVRKKALFDQKEHFTIQWISWVDNLGSEKESCGHCKFGLKLLFSLIFTRFIIYNLKLYAITIAITRKIRILALWKNELLFILLIRLHFQEIFHWFKIFQKRDYEDDWSS